MYFIIHVSKKTANYYRYWKHSYVIIEKCSVAERFIVKLYKKRIVRSQKYTKTLKLVGDFLMSIIGILILSPIFLLIALVLFCSYRGKSPFFIQPRVGKHEKIFNVLKFKTMNDNTDSDGILLADALRLTAIGAIIRKTSLDEITQLFNVLRGDMSIVGPRPLLVEYLPLYDEIQRKRHDIKPGITGWAQVNGRNAIAWKRKFEFDVYYVENVSFFLDLKIIILTVLKVIQRKGISASVLMTAEPFKGNN